MWSKEESSALRATFWHKLESKTRRLPGQRGRAKSWIGKRTGVPGLDLRFDITGGRVMVAIEVNTHHEDRDAELWIKLLECRPLLQQHFEEPLTFDENFLREAGNRVCRVYTAQVGNVNDREQWADMIHFMIDRMLRLERAWKVVCDYVVERGESANESA